MALVGGKMALVGPQVCETPNYPSNYGIPQGLGMEVSLCSMDFENDYRLDLPKIKAMVKENTKVIRQPGGAGGKRGSQRALCVCGGK